MLAVLADVGDPVTWEIEAGSLLRVKRASLGCKVIPFWEVDQLKS